MRLFCAASAKSIVHVRVDKDEMYFPCTECSLICVECGKRFERRIKGMVVENGKMFPLHFGAFFEKVVKFLRSLCSILL